MTRFRSLSLTFLLASLGCGSTPVSTAGDAGAPPPPICTGPGAPWAGWRDAHPPYLVVQLEPGELNGGVDTRSRSSVFADFDGGPCGAVVFPPGTSGSSSPPYPNAGPLTFASPQGSITVVPSDAGYSYGMYLGWPAPPPYSAGDSLTLSGPGAEIAAFSLELTAPTPATILSPQLPSDGGALEIDPDAGLTITWANASCGDRVVVTLSTSGVDTEYSLRCAVPASQGSYTISPQVLGQGWQGLTVETYRESVGDAGGWPIVWEARAAAVQGTRAFGAGLRGP